MIYKPFFRDDLGYKPRYTQPLHLEEVVVSPIYDSENEDSEIDINSLGYKPVYKNIWEGVEINPSKKESVLSYTFQSKEDFKNTMIPIYANILSEKGLNPLFAKSLVAQDGLESAWGSVPSGDNNFGGIKGKGRIKSTREVINGKDIYLEQEFRNFNSLEDYARYKVNLLNGKRYKAFDGELEDFSRRVSSGGYATDPRYKEILDKVIKSVKKGGRIEKASLGTIFSTNEPRGQRRSGVALKDYYDWYNYHNKTYGNGSHSLPEEFGSIILDPGLDNYNIKEDYVPTINDLLEFTTSYEGFKSKPYELNGQILIGHGLSDESLIEKYRYTGIPEDVSREEVLSRLKDILSRHEELVPGFKELPMSIKLAITDTVYNGKGDNELINTNPISKRLKSAIAKGDVMSIVKELDHSKSAGGWLGIRSAARRAMALGEYMWDYKYKDRLGRHINPSKSHDKDYMTSPYVKYIDM